MARLIAFVFAMLATAASVHAESSEAVALLPLDADRELEIYGQPVASEIARALVAGAIEVVVVGPKMAVPERAWLIVDGTITRGKQAAVVLTIRVRDPVDGTVLTTTGAIATGLATIDQAAAELSARVLPAVRGHLAAKRPPPHSDEPGPAPPARQPPAPPKPRPLLVAISGGAAGSPFSAAFGTAVGAWAGSQRRAPTAVEPGTLAVKAAPATVKASGADVAIAFEIGGFAIGHHGEIPLGRARVRVRIADATGILFDRVVVTDSVVGERAMLPDALAARTAREVLAILRPHVRRAVPGWR